MRKIIHTLIIVVFFIIFTHQSYSKVFMWEIENNKKTSYILGSIHTADSSIYPMNKIIENAFNNTEYLVVEANINKSNEDILKLAYLPKGQTLDSILTKETYEKLKSKFKQYKVPSFTFKSFKPWFAAIYLTQLELINSGYDFNLGIDKYFIDKKPQDKILELESSEYQINLLNEVGEYYKNDFVEYTLKELENSKSNVDSMFVAWRNGDAEQLELITMTDEMKSSKFKIFIEKLLFERNNHMTTRIVELLNSDKTYFIIVGAGHLIGEKGIINQLKKLNYKVNQK